jgi:hypothetical protein
MVKIWVLIAFIALSIPVLGLDKDEKSAIKAIKTGDIGLLKSYLEKHPDLDCKFSNGRTGLYYAVVYDQVKVSEYLLKRGADPNLTVSDYSTLKWAIRYDRGRIARLLIEYGAEVNEADKKLDSPLIYAAGLNNLEICKILIDRGANPLYENQHEKRASDYAINFDNSPAYKYLLLMEKQCQNQDSIPSMKDGPYIYWEAEDQVVMTYYERNQDKNLTRLVEKTIEIGKADTVVDGIGWDKNSYHIKHQYAPNSSEVKTAGNIFAIGDIHGKYNALVNLLIKNKVIDSDLKWIFGEGQLVLLGDVFDRGALVTEALWFLYELQFQAQDAGGNVHLLLGNHEIMELTGDDRYLNTKYNYFTQYTQVYYFQLFEKNTVLGRWLRSQNIMVRINDDLFMHAGISPEFAAYDYTYSDINSRIRNYLNSGKRDEDGSPEDIILGPVGPLWYRGYYNTNYNDNINININGNINDKVQEVTQQFVDDYLNSKGLKRMILGHNEQSKINASYEGKIISADVEIDESGKSAQGLLISGDEIFRCFSDGIKERIE